MANYQQSGGRNGLSDDDRTSWRPQDQQPSFRNRDDDDDRRWHQRGNRDDDRYAERDLRGYPGYQDERFRGAAERYGTSDRYSTSGYGGSERYGQGQSGYGQIRYSDERYWPDRSGYDADRYSGSGSSRGERMGYQGHIDQSADNLRHRRAEAPFQQQQDERAQHVHRGTGPHRGRGPLGYTRSDERLREMVCESLMEDDEIDASHIEVAVKNGEVSLTGTVDDRRAKREAEDCAASIVGVRDVQNQLRVHDERAATSGKPAAESKLEAGAPDKADKKYRA